ncbi:hypothetical protein Tco_1003328 [Tanacetum coccineum]|uniref:Uncharacterized protein n=1 Tax=Tanacetum coccineum TaxID=301880 RepID=A0ABQ5F954_9ASTR
MENLGKMEKMEKRKGWLQYGEDGSAGDDEECIQNKFTPNKVSGEREMERMRNKVQKKCKIRGFSLRRDALTEIYSFVRDFEDAEDEAINLILDELSQL